MKRMAALLRPVRGGLFAFSVSLALLGGGAKMCFAEELPVDAALVLAVDVSSSMQPAELALQRQGYAAAFRSRDVVDAIRDGAYGRVAVTYVEWGSSNAHRVVLPWTLIDGAATAAMVADRLEATRIATMFRTSISGAIRVGMRSLDDMRFNASRRIIDISGDGPNNEGGPVEFARDTAVRAGITVNGLPIMVKPILPVGGQKLPPLDAYYADCVAGGERAFVLPVTNWQQFPPAVRRKLVMEVSGRDPAIRYAAANGSPDMLLPGKGADCEIGEEFP